MSDSTNSKELKRGPCKHEGCVNEAYTRWHNGWKKWIYSSECKTCTANLKKYGIHTGQRNQMMEEQDGMCQICNSPVKFSQGLGLSSTDATVDHCHATGKVRGILCGSCNNMLGRARDSIQILKNSIEYLRKHGQTD